MRLTLRTLLAYLDDMLDPAETKLIGQKVAESDHAQELIARIKQVTRRRRLTTPPATGPNAFEPNTVAEYLDNTLSPEQVAEVEKACLESDVHLAEIAARAPDPDAGAGSAGPGAADGETADARPGTRVGSAEPSGGGRARLNGAAAPERDARAEEDETLLWAFLSTAARRPCAGCCRSRRSCSWWSSPWRFIRRCRSSTKRPRSQSVRKRPAPRRPRTLERKPRGPDTNPQPEPPPPAPPNPPPEPPAPPPVPAPPGPRPVVRPQPPSAERVEAGRYRLPVPVGAPSILATRRLLPPPNRGSASKSEDRIFTNDAAGQPAGLP